METISFIEQLERTARDVMRDRLRTWMIYKFEKEMLPELLAEATRSIRIECYTNANIPEDIRIQLRFDKTEGAKTK